MPSTATANTMVRISITTSRHLTRRQRENSLSKIQNIVQSVDSDGAGAIWRLTVNLGIVVNAATDSIRVRTGIPGPAKLMGVDIVAAPISNGCVRILRSRWLKKLLIREP